MRDKRGIGVVVVSVFIIFITVATVAITWFWIVPWTQDVESSRDTNANLRVVLEGYTAYDEEQEMAFVQVKRGADYVDVVALDVIFNVEGNSFVFRTKDAPDNNEMVLYYFDFGKEEIIGFPQFVKIAPVFSEGASERVGLARGEVVIPGKKVTLDDWNATRVKAADNVLKEDVVEEFVGEPVSICKDDFIEGEVYVLEQGYRLLSGSNCFEIYVDDVVLDLNGYLILGDYSGYGVYIKGDNVTVKNGRIEKFEKGIFIDGLGADSDNTIVDNYFFDNNNSIYVDVSAGNLIARNNMLNGNYSNIYLKNSRDNHVTNNWACGSSRDIYCDGSIDNYGEGNTFSAVVNCPYDWLGAGGVGYAECED